MKIRQYAMVGLVCLLVLSVLPVSLSAQEDDREDMLLVIVENFDEETTLFRVSLDGNYSQELAEVSRKRQGDPIVISPDEEWILYWDVDQRLHRIRVNGIDDQQLTDNPTGELTWSPDNQWLIFQQCNATCDLYAVQWKNEEILTVQRLTNLMMAATKIEAWSPDNQWLVFADISNDRTERNLYRLKIGEPGRVQQITDLPGKEDFIGWGDNGQWLVFESHSNRDDFNMGVFYSVPVEDDTINLASAIRLMPDACWLDELSWSQDRQWMLFSTSFCEMNYSPGLKGLHLVGEPKIIPLADGEYFYSTVHWIVDNQEFVLQGWPTNQLLHVQLDSTKTLTSTVTTIADSYRSVHIGVSPDKNWIYFPGSLSGKDETNASRHLYRMHPDGTEVEPVFELGYEDRAWILDWTVDKQWMVVFFNLFHNFNMWHPVGTYLVRPDGSELRPVLTSDHLLLSVEEITSPDGQWMFLREYSTTWVGPWYFMPLDSSKLEDYQLQLIKPPHGFYSLSHLAIHSWSPDDNWVFFSGDLGFEYQPHQDHVFRAPIGSPDLEYVHPGRIVGWIHASR